MTSQRQEAGPLGHSLLGRVLAALVVLTFAAAIGSLVGRWPLVGLATLVVAIAGSAAVVVLSRRPLHVAAMWGLIVLHAITMVANFWLMSSLDAVTDLTRAVATAGLALLLLAATGPRFVNSPPRTTTFLVSGYALWAILGGQFAVSPSRSLLVGGSLLTMVLVIGLVIGSWKDPAQAWEAFLRGQVAVGLVVCVACVLVSLSGAEQARNLRFTSQSLLPAFKGLFSNSILLGELGTLTAGGILALLTLRPQERFTPLRMAIIGLCLICLLASGARSPLLGMMLTVGVFWLFLERRRITPQTAAGLLIAGGAALFVVVQLGAIETTFQRLSATEVGEEGRLVIWATAVDVFLQSPITGQGFGTTSGQFGFMEARIVEDLSLHNALLDYGLTAGLPGMFLFAVLLVRCVLGVVRTRDRRLAASLIVAFAGVIPIGLTNTTMAVMSVMPWMLWFPLVFSSSLLDWAEQTQVRPLRSS